jgi:hypothetical protein
MFKYHVFENGTYVENASYLVMLTGTGIKKTRLNYIVGNKHAFIVPGESNVNFIRNIREKTQ